MLSSSSSSQQDDLCTDQSALSVINVFAKQDVNLQPDLSPPPPPASIAGELHHHKNYHQEIQQFEMMNKLSNYTPPSIYLRQLLLTCANSISRCDFTTAHRITTILTANSSPYGDSSERLIYAFTKAFSSLLNNPVTTNTNYPTNDDTIIQSSYLSLNQITPFVRFTHLTANQTILEAIDQASHDHNHKQHDIHILDFDIMHGVQWPPLMQAIADRDPRPTLRISASGTHLETLCKTGDRLSKFAHSVGLRFRFFPLLLPQNTNNHSTVDDVINHLSAVILLPNEILAVNCVLYLHRLLTDREKVCTLLRKIKSMNPKVVTLAEKEANHNHPLFVSRFEEALNYYSAIFESLEATLPPNSAERMAVEQVWFGREIGDILMKEGEMRRESHERFISWDMMMRIAGFRNVGLSSFALAQAKLLLRLHYPSEGYNLQVVNDSFFLGWQNQPLFSVSSWH
ncbi:scarecrow-like protein 18 [Rutidosis leptorrhynchoides]|uniref:scarecrow-like protein 18 n=1 Tax=Rutidosis leptorrhynchoides TaxID=125765 RepID=UPI003A9953BB